LKGPNDDWPLAVCDFTSIALDQDLTSNDALHQKRVGENWLLHSNPAHKWYYMSAQDVDDILVFRNTDSEGLRSSTADRPVFSRSEANLLFRRMLSCRVSEPARGMRTTRKYRGPCCRLSRLGIARCSEVPIAKYQQLSAFPPHIFTGSQQSLHAAKLLTRVTRLCVQWCMRRTFRGQQPNAVLDPGFTTIKSYCEYQ